MFALCPCMQIHVCVCVCVCVCVYLIVHLNVDVLSYLHRRTHVLLYTHYTLFLRQGTTFTYTQHQLSVFESICTAALMKGSTKNAPQTQMVLPFSRSVD